MASTTVDELALDLNTGWLLLTGSLVFWMQAGFALVEAGSVRVVNVQNILYKNALDAAIGALAFWLVGYGFAFGGGPDDDNGFIGGTNFGLSEIGDSNGELYAFWFFQWAFSATAATIVSGAVAERCKLSAYFIYSFFISAWIYPVVVHWVWDAQGFMSAANPTPIFTKDADSTGLIDFAGSGVVHMVGGYTALVAAYMVGPRHGRFNDKGEVQEMKGHSSLLVALGVFILWLGWYGFNPGSTLGLAYGFSKLASKVAINTTLASCTGALTVTAVVKYRDDRYDVGATLNGFLAGLVAVTAPCAVCEPWGSFIIGFSASFVYLGASALLLKLKIDDPVDASPIHAGCGTWGVICSGIFASDAGVKFAYFKDNDAYSSGRQLGLQIVGALIIASWATFWAFVMFKTLALTVGLRVDLEHEKEGLDKVEHGGPAYYMDYRRLTATKDARKEEPKNDASKELELTEHASDSKQGS